jgi:formylglycine-generating enzyme required for sulfatase activity
LSIAQEVEPATIERHRGRWEACLDQLNDDNRYRGVLSKAQVGLIPLGRNAQGTYDFLHWASHSGESDINADWNPADTNGRLKSEVGIILTLLPGGSFTMGSPKEEIGRDSLEQEHIVTLAPFFIGKYELTQAQWMRGMGSNPSEHYAGKQHKGRVAQDITNLHPVDSVNWLEAKDLAQKFDLDLPTEAQWEYAARAGTTTPWTFGGSEGELQGKVNLYDESGGKGFGDVEGYRQQPWDDGWFFHAPVDEFAPNSFGIFGIHGNLCEWCRDSHVERYPPDSVVPGDGMLIGPFDPTHLKAFRDGSWLHPASKARSATRYALPAETRGKFLGVRVARAIDP